MEEQITAKGLTDFAGGVSLISRHATDHNILLIFARHFLQSFNVEGLKGHVICGCAQDYGCLCNCFSLILCLFETCSKEKPSALFCIQVQSYFIL